jgi:hypothetical protein
LDSAELNCSESAAKRSKVAGIQPRKARSFHNPELVWKMEMEASPAHWGRTLWSRPSEQRAKSGYRCLKSWTASQTRNYSRSTALRYRLKASFCGSLTLRNY